MAKIRFPLINHKNILETVILVTIVASATLIKLWRLGEHAFVFDEAIYVSIAKYFVANGFNWQVERELGSSHTPLQLLILGWNWVIAQRFWPWATEEFIFRLPSVIMSSLTIPIIYLLARRFGLFIALTATLFFAFHPYIIIYTRYASLDFPALFWMTLGIYFYVNHTSNLGNGLKRHSQLWLSGIFIGLATLTKIYTLMLLGPIFLHALLLAGRKPKEIAAATLAWFHVVGASIFTIIVVSSLLFKTPFMLYLSIMQTAQTVYTLPSEMVNRPELKFLGLVWDEVLGMRRVLQTMWSHIGWGAFLIILVGAFRLIDEDKKLGRIGLFFVVFIITGIMVFAPFHWPRYLLAMGSVIPILYAFGVKDLFHRAVELRKKFTGKRRKLNLGLIPVAVLFASLGASLIPLRLLPEMYRVQMVDDWVYGNGLKEAALYIRERAKKDEWIMTNGHYPILSYYADVPAHFYMGFGPQLRIYQIYNSDTRQPAVINVNSEDEKKLQFIVVDNTPDTDFTYLYQPQVRFSYALVNRPLLEYIDNYFKPAAEFQNGVVRVYQRNSRNYSNPLTNPEIWVGEGGAHFKENLPNANGWILGAGWGQPQAVVTDTETYRGLPALRDGNRFADFVLPVTDTGLPATLEITYQDKGMGKATIESLQDSAVRTAPRLIRTLGEIQLTNSGAIQKAFIPLPTPLYFDNSPDIPGHQQQFSFATTQNPLPVIKLSLSQEKDNALEKGIGEVSSFIKSQSKPGDLVMTNSRHNSISVYTGLPTYFYIGFQPDLKILKTREDGKATAGQNLSWSEEKNLRYIIMDKRSLADTSLRSYLETYYSPVSQLTSDILQVFERKTHNIFSLLAQPKLWVGESGEVLNPNLVNYNGWIFGEGWGQSMAITVNNETYWVRSAIREGARYADFILPIRDTTKLSTLEIMFQDVGTGQISINSLLAEPRQGQQERFLRPFAEIQLTNSGAIKTATVPLREVYFYDASPDVSGHQQHFSFFTQGSPIQVIEVGIVQQ